MGKLRIFRLSEGDEELARAAVGRLKDPVEPAREPAGKYHMRRLLSDGANYLYVATVDEMPVGFLIAYRMPRIDRNEDMIYLYEISVDRRHRRRGIGRALIEALKRGCVGNNIMKMWVGTEVDNLAARRLYESTGAIRQREDYTEYVYEDLDQVST